MSETIPVNKKSRGRPRVGATLVGVRIEPDLLAWLDAERAKLEPEATRPEMIRRILAKESGHD